MINRQTTAALTGSAGHVGLILCMTGPADMPTLIYLSGKTERTIRTALTQLQALGLATSDNNGLWTTTLKAVDNPVDNTTEPQPSPAEPCENLLQNGANLLQNGANLPQNHAPTSHARVSSSSKLNKKEKEDKFQRENQNQPSTAVTFTRPPAEARQLRQILADAGIAKYSRKMDEILEAHWVTLEYATAHIAAWHTQKQPVSYLITRLCDGDPAPPPPPARPIPADAHWLDDAIHDLSPDVALSADTATNDDARALPPPHPRWETILSELKLQLTSATFNKLLLSSHAHSDGDQLVIIPSNQYDCQWIAKLAPTILRTFNAISDRPATAVVALTHHQWQAQQIQIEATS